MSICYKETLVVFDCEHTRMKPTGIEQ